VRFTWAKERNRTVICLESTDTQACGLKWKNRFEAVEFGAAVSDKKLLIMG
jgi:hypothetical protein